MVCSDVTTVQSQGKEAAGKRPSSAQSSAGQKRAKVKQAGTGKEDKVTPKKAAKASIGKSSKESGQKKGRDGKQSESPGRLPGESSDTLMRKVHLCLCMLHAAILLCRGILQ